MAIELNAGQRVQRKYLIHVAEWEESGTKKREILGARTPSSAIEFNNDINKETDIRGKTYTDVNKTEPQQDFDPHYIMGGSDLDKYLSKSALANNIDNYNGVFTIYTITAYDGGQGTYYATMQKNCTIEVTSLGGESYVEMPITVHYSNDITEGTVDKLSDDFVFTPA